MTEAGLTWGSPRARWVIAATVLGSGMASLDATVVGIALPTVGRSFHAGVSTVQWVVTAYTLTLAAFLLLGGSLGDRFGRKRVFIIGVVWFACASALCGVAPNASFLIVARAIQGIGAALLTPGSLAILQASFAPADRSRAIGAWSGFGGLATAAGPLIGGELIAIASWRWVFYLNIPVAAGVVHLAAREVPESHDPDAAGRVDAPGAALGVIWLTALTYALIEGPSLGWTSGTTLGALGVAVAALAGFIATERRTRYPMLPLGVFRERQFTVTNAVTFAIYGALAGALFLLPIELQVVSRYTPLESGLALLPVTLIMLALSARSGMLASRIGPRLQMATGPLVVAAGLALLARAADGSNYVTYVLPAVVVFGLGLAITVAPLTSTAMGSAPAEHAGIASAINNDVARAAGLIAVAVIPVVAGITGASYLHAADLASGFRIATRAAAALCATGGLLAAALIRNPAPCPNDESFHSALDAPPLRESVQEAT